MPEKCRSRQYLPYVDSWDSQHVINGHLGHVQEGEGGQDEENDVPVGAGAVEEEVMSEPNDEGSDEGSENDLNQPSGDDNQETLMEDEEDDEIIRPHWTIYRVNPFNRPQRLYCYVGVPGEEGQQDITDLLQACWPVRDPHALQFRQVHHAVLRSQAARGAQQVSIVEYTQDGKQFFPNCRSVLVEVLMIYQGSWTSSRVTAVFVDRRGNIPTVLRRIDEVIRCQRSEATCYGFQNGEYRPWFAMMKVWDGDFFQIQILRDMPPLRNTQYYLAESPEASVQLDTSRCIAATTDPIVATRVLVLRAHGIGGPRRASLSFLEEPNDDYDQYIRIFSEVWDDMIQPAWQIVRVSDTYRMSEFLRRWGKIYLIDHENERHPGYAFVLVETNEAALIDHGHRLRAIWIVPVLSRAMFYTLMDVHSLCTEDDENCMITLNGRVTQRGEVLQLRHGDYLFLDFNRREPRGALVTMPSSMPYNQKEGIGNKAKILLTVLCIDLGAAILTYAALRISERQPCKRLCKVRQRRYSRKCRDKSKYWPIVKAVIWIPMIITADAMPILMSINEPLLSGYPRGTADSIPRMASDWDRKLLLAGYPGDDPSCVNHSSIVSPLSGNPGYRCEHGIDGWMIPFYDLALQNAIQVHNDNPADEEQRIIPELRPIPHTMAEAQANRRPRVRITRELETISVLQGLQQTTGGEVMIVTYGLYDGPVGTRSRIAVDVQARTIRDTIHDMWQDYAYHFDMLIYMVRPQPPGTNSRSAALQITFVVRFVDHELEIPNNWRSVLVDQSMQSPSGIGITTIRAAAFLVHPSTVIDVYQVVRVATSCFPNGIRPCVVVWRDGEYAYPDRILPEDGGFLVVRIGSLEQYFAHTGDYFAGARRFALDGQRLYAASMTMRQSSDTIWVWTHAVDTNNRPLGYRVLTAPLRDLLQPERIWNRAYELWRDCRPPRSAKLFHVIPQPKRQEGEILNKLHVIFAFNDFTNKVPVLILTQLTTEIGQVTSHDLQWQALHCISPQTDQELVQTTGIHAFMRHTNTEFVLQHGYRDVDNEEEFMLQPGNLVVIRIFVPTLLNIVRRLWAIVEPDQEDHSLIQVRAHRKYAVVSTFDDLRPPGNGAIVDLRHDFEALDDCTYHDWGCCLFDVGGAAKQLVTSLSIDTPDLSSLLENIHNQIPLSAPCELLWQNLHLFEEDLQPFVQGLDLGEHPQPEVLHIYTDGSYDGTRPGEEHVGWGFAAFVCGKGTYQLVHLAYGCIIDDQCPIAHGIPVQLNARTGEIEALLQATLWSLTHPGFYPVDIYFDAIAVGYGAMGQWNIPLHDKHARTLRALVQYAERFHEKGFKGSHVKAHTGILGNEIANFLAQHGRLSQTSKGMVEVELGRYLTGNRMPIEWLWLHIIPESSSDVAYPKISSGRIEASGMQLDSDYHTAFPSQLLSTATMDTKITHTQFSVATYNVGSLCKIRPNGNQEGLCPQEYLRRQTQSHGITCLMLQETRARTSGMINSDTHLRLIAASDGGRGGTEIWLAKRTPTGRKLGLHQSDVIVLLSEAEILCVRVKWAFGQFLIISAHSPHSGYNVEQVQQWWSRFNEMVDRFHTAAVEWLVIGIDANTNFSEDMPPCIGSLGLTEHANHISRHFKDFLLRHNLFLPSTFEDYHRGETHTWRVVAEQNGARCDYVCLPVVWKSNSIDSQNLPNLDAGTSTFDHTAVGAWCQLAFHRSSRTKPQCDPRKIQEQLPLHGDKLFPKLQEIPWQCDVHQHAVQISASVTEWLNEYCAAEVSKPRADYITEETWKIRSIRLWLARSMRRLNGMVQCHDLQIAFTAWRSQQTYQEIAKNVFDTTWQMVGLQRRVQQTIKWTRSLLKKNLRKDRTSYLEQVVEKATDDHPSVFYKHLRSIGVRSKNKRSPMQPLPCLRDLQGELVTTFRQWSEVWRQQFEKQEDGKLRTHQELLDLCLDNQQWNRDLDEPVTWEQLPSLMELEKSLRQSNVGKAFFDDGIPGEFLHFAAHSVAPAMYPLLLKQWLFHREALLFKGGLLISAYKSGDAMNTCNYRSLLVSPTLGKTLHRLLRQDLMKHFEPKALPLQLGGRPGIAVSQASHVLHAFLHTQRCLKRPAAVIFVDIRNAFYRLFRQHLVRHGAMAETVGALFQSLELPEEAFEDFKTQLSGMTATEAINTPKYLQAQIKEVLNATWFMIPGSHEVTEARRGSRPGDSMADLLFTIAFRHLLAKVQDQLREDGVLVELWWTGQKEPLQSSELLQRLDMLGPIWADDLAVMVEAENAYALMNKVKKVTGLLLDHLLVHGMQPNLKPSKSEIFVDLRGPGSIECRRSIDADNYSLHTSSAYLSEPMRIVGAYKHLGTWVQTNGKVTKELNCRFGTAHQTMTRYKGAIFANRAMKLGKKVQLFNSLVLSAVFYNSPTWMMTRKHDVQKLHSGTMSLYRRVAMGHFGIVSRQWTDEKIQAALELPQPIDLLHVYRLRYVQHLVKAGDDVVWAMLQQNQYWWQMVDLSLRWLKDHTLRILPDETCIAGWDLWQPWLIGNGRAWRTMVRQAMLHSALQNRKESLWQDFHRSICQTVLEATLYDLPADTLEIDQHACPRCRQVFPTCSAWSVHAFRKHGRRTPARLYAKGRTCEFCLKVYHDHMGLVNHISNTPQCFWQYSTRGEQVQPQPSLNSAMEIKARVDLRCPVTRMQGPTPVPQPVADPIPTLEQSELLDAWRQVVWKYPFDTLDVVEMREDLRVATLDTYLPTYEILYVARCLRLQLQRDGEAVQDVGIHRALTNFINDYSVEWLLRDQAQPRKEVKDPQSILHRWRGATSHPRVVNRPLQYRQIFIAHLFSGRRRVGDFQDWAMQEVWSSTEFTTIALSVDIIFSEEWGNLSNPRTYAWFVDAIKAQYLVGILAGPPCETWSVARERGLYEDDGPRPLRSSMALSGFAGLSNRETRQLCVGNELLGVAVTLATHLWIAGGICIIEHPSEPKKATAPSIWRTEALQFLLAHEENLRCLVHQGYFGARSAKPTEFLITHAPKFVEQIFRSNRVRNDLPAAVSVGVNDQGQFHTASLKEYPLALSRSLWQVVSAQLRQRSFSGHPQDCPEDVLQKFGKLHALLDYDVQTMGPDYHPTGLN